MGALLAPLQRYRLRYSRQRSFKATSSGLYDEFLARIFMDESRATGKLQAIHAKGQIQYAVFCLNHPQEPMPAPGLQALQALAGGEDSRMNRPKDTTAENFFYNVTLYIAKLRQDQGRSDEAAWAEELAQKTFSTLWRQNRNKVHRKRFHDSNAKLTSDLQLFEGRKADS